ncbi:MAG: type II toxin-antitoxin system VapC family toxin [Solirubrobacterales bacterium]
MGYGARGLTILDTHVLVWLVASPERISARGRRAIAADSELAISMASIQEIAYLVVRGRLAMDRPLGVWIRDALAVHEVQALPTTVPACLRAGSLDPEGFHGDPVDRLIYATAVEHDAQLVTADGRLRKSDPARTIW